MDMKPTKSKRAATLLLAVILLVTATVTANAAVSDVKPGNWAYDAVQFNVENNLIAIDYSKYNMNAPAPRQDVAYAMFKLTNGKDAEPTKSQYTQYIPQDMQSSPDRYKYSVQWAVLNKLIAGTKSNGEKFTSTNYQLWFSPTSIITREQMATLLYRLAQYDGLNTDFLSYALCTFTDMYTISDWAYDAMRWCVTHGLMSGTGNNRLSPRTTLTYGQLAQFMMNYAKFKGEGTETPDVTPSPSPDVTPNPTPDVTDKRSGNYYNQIAYPDDAKDSSWLTLNSDYVITDLSGPWDKCQPITTLPNGGYMKNGHRYNKYNVCIDTVDGMPTDEEKKALIIINQHRINNGIQPLIWDQAVQVIAETRAIEGYKCHTNVTSEWAHVRPDGSGHSSITNEWNKIGLLTHTNYSDWPNECAIRLEGAPTISNWGVNCDNYADVIKYWFNSSGHNAALLDSNVQYGAVACSHLNDTDNGYFWYYNSLHAK